MKEEKKLILSESSESSNTNKLLNGVRSRKRGIRCGVVYGKSTTFRTVPDTV